ncbi:MAG: [FeFe] hydrogenase H-cluster radical SAM maturase HydE [Ruminococcaceae bacterium]|nr:[FeFe] hydrogenase H-cluster radical SAM maturase HydE [Oscillospiraceae bacterium]
MTMKKNIQLIDKLKLEHELSHEEYLTLLETMDADDENYLFSCAVNAVKSVYGNKIFIRGLIEVTNHCKNDCYYCGIRRSNTNVCRYRLTKDDIMQCCETGYEIGFRTFVMQGGEDALFTDSFMCEVISEIKKKYPDCAVTLSLGERSYQSYKAMKEAGADRYLLRHESIDPVHYSLLHPPALTIENRKKCLYDLKSLGYQVGCGIMVGSPYQTLEHIAKDLLFIQEFKPHMIGIGPFIPHHQTPFKEFEAGSVQLTLRLLAIVRLIDPKSLIPATTALNSLDPEGRIKGIKAGANVVMPNLSPEDVRADYALYDNKAYTACESAQALEKLKEQFRGIGYEIQTARGDYAR